jgi:hypothetical protein
MTTDEPETDTDTAPANGLPVEGLPPDAGRRLAELEDRPDRA